MKQYETSLKKREIPVSRYADYRKWLRYHLDFRRKYPLPNPRSEQVRLFIEKLRNKKQSQEQQKQAAQEVRVDLTINEFMIFSVSKFINIMKNLGYKTRVGPLDPLRSDPIEYS